MHPPPEIKNLKEFLEPSLNGAKVLDFSTKFLTAVGDNYGSLMLALSVIIQKPNKNAPQILELVAKLPSTNQHLFELFQTETTFIKENAMYTEVFPALLQLQRDMNVPKNDIFEALPICFGARISLDKKSKEIDTNAVLLLENLRIRGFVVGDRVKGFDYEHSRLVIKNLAYFSALPIALKYLKPRVYEEKVLQYVTRIDMTVTLEDHEIQELRDSLHRNIDDINEISYLHQRIKDQIEMCIAWQNNLGIDSEPSPYTTIVHNDFWVNNMMINYDKQGNPNAVKIVDFQLMMMESFVHDLIFFLFSSVEDDVFDDKFDELIKYFYDCFYQCLKATKCPLEDFTYEKFLNEIKLKAPYQLFHILIMLKVSLAVKESIPDLNDIESDMFIKDDIVGPGYLEKFKKVLQVYEAKKWII